MRFVEDAAGALKCKIVLCEGAYLLRKLSRHAVVDPITSKTMCDHALYFEALAIRVQSIALEEDQHQAAQVMNMPLIIWREMSLLDLAMEAGCERFVPRDEMPCLLSSWHADNPSRTIVSTRAGTPHSACLRISLTHACESAHQCN